MHTTFQSIGTVQAGFENTQPQKRNFARKAPVDPYARTAGTIHTLDLNTLSAKQNTVNRLAQASDPTNNEFVTALSYATEGNQATDIPKQEDTGYSFADVVDAINPLHHIPLVNTLYRGITGDEIKPASQILGGTIYGGPIGAVSSTINVVVEHETGRDMTGNALALIAGDAIKKPEVRIDRSKDILDFTNTLDTPLAGPLKKTNFWNAARTYERMGGFNS